MDTTILSILRNFKFKEKINDKFILSYKDIFMNLNPQNVQINGSSICEVILYTLIINFSF